MKVISSLSTIILFCFSISAIAVPVAPALTYSIDGVTVTVEWTEVVGATQYRLSYAPSPAFDMIDNPINLFLKYTPFV